MLAVPAELDREVRRVCAGVDVADLAFVAVILGGFAMCAAVLRAVVMGADR